MEEYEYLGIAYSWGETFKKARTLLEENKFEAVAILSKKEFESGNYVSIMLEDYRLSNLKSETEALVQLLAVIPPLLYVGNVKFQMAIRKNLESYTLAGLKNISIFIVIYLKQDEEPIEF